MAAATGIWNHMTASAGPMNGAKAAPMAGPASGSGGTNGTGGSTSTPSDDSATISANDFLTLLVTEMQNQDPTADTDPNEYINQLVNVNSLEQLISINQNLTTALGSSSSSSSGASAQSQVSSSGARVSGKSAAGAVQSVATKGNHAPTAAAAAGAKVAPGNLSVPEARPAAHRVAGALSGRAHASSVAGRY